MEMNAPIKLEMKVYALSDDDNTQGIITMSLPLGRYPTRSTLESIYEKAKENLPEGYRVMNKSEFFNAYLEEEYGSREKFATPGSKDFINDSIEN